DYPNQDERKCFWNARFDNGSYYGDFPASYSWSGYVQLDIMSDGRTVIAYHYNAGAGYYSWIDIDAGNLSGAFGDPKSPEVADHIWPYIAVAGDNIIMVTGDYSGDYADMHHLYITTDEGVTWTYIADYDSCTTLSQFIRASPFSDKVVHVWTQSMDLEDVSQWCNDVYYELSTDNGITWSAPINITNYTPPDSMSAGDSVIWAFNNVNALFDANDNLHIAWGGHLAWVSAGDTLYGGDRAKIFHWDEVSGIISTVSSPSIYYNEPGGWWLEPWVNGAPYGHGGAAGTWRTVCDQPQLVVDPVDNDLYCLWSGNDDSTDVALNTYINGEIYGAKSWNNGATWTNYVNLTNTPSHGAAAGDCFDEDYFTVNPLIVNDSMFVTFIEDKDAGAYVHGGAMTDNPVHCWVFWVPNGIEEEQSLKPTSTKPILKISPNPFAKLTHISFGIGHPDRITHSSYGTGRAERKALKIYDASGRLIKDFSLPTAYCLVPTTIKWSGTDQLDRPVPPGVYFVQLQAGDFTTTKKIIKIE
ncbi:T9SS type A sorting domain-containing protein, partial [candidate division WOR-3 bacterium]|nr:T9SS type A sorting domain-containing protein [candidate division WOR-3 bacterium]